MGYQLGDTFAYFGHFLYEKDGFETVPDLEPFFVAFEDRSWEARHAIGSSPLAPNACRHFPQNIYFWSLFRRLWTSFCELLRYPGLYFSGMGTTWNIDGFRDIHRDPPAEDYTPDGG